MANNEQATKRFRLSFSPKKQAPNNCIIHYKFYDKGLPLRNFTETSLERVKHARLDYLDFLSDFNFLIINFLLFSIIFYFSVSTTTHKNNETNDKFYRKVAFLTEMVNFTPKS